MENIVFIANQDHYKNWIGKAYYDLITYVRNNNNKYNITIFWTDDNPTIALDKIKYLNPIFIIYFETDKTEFNNFDFVFNLNIPVAFALLDMFYINRIKNHYNIIKSKSLIHFSTNQSMINSYSKIFPDKYITCFNSRFINTNVYKDWNLEKKYDILIYGTRNVFRDYKNENIEAIQNSIKKYEEKTNTIINDEINFYPLRSYLEKILLKYSHKYNLKILPEKCIFDANVANEDLSMLINQSYLTVSCCSIADVLFHKYLEISGSKSVILGNYPSDYEDLFKGNIIEVNEFMSEEEIINIIDNALSDKKKLNEMSLLLYKKVHDEHNFNKAVENFNNVFDDIINQNTI
jgi:hypothetical protein